MAELLKMQALLFGQSTDSFRSKRSRPAMRSCRETSHLESQNTRK